VLLSGEVIKLCSNICVKEGQIQALCGLTLIQFLGPSLKKIQNFEYKFRESEYLFRMRTEIITRYKLKALTNITNITKSRKIT